MTEERAKRKLSGILSADAVGYSRLMRLDEAATVATLKEHKKVMALLIEKYRGREVDSPGDNLLAEFNSVVDAVECAVEIQKKLKNKNIMLAEDRKMEFRIGIHLGDVLEEEDRIYGDGVNIAARIEGLAQSGGICISRTAFDSVKDKLSFGYKYLGEHRVKNIAEPVRVYRILMDPGAVGKVIGEKRFLGRVSRRVALSAIIILGIVAGGLIGWNIYLQQSKKIEPASMKRMAFPLPEKPSIVVLPFVNMSGDPEQEYFSDGTTEEIINGLSKIPNMFVIARHSSFSYKGKPVKVQQVAEELGVRYVMEGSVRVVGDRVRVTAQLIDAITGHHLWSERYDRVLDDIFAIQDDITVNIMQAMQMKVAGLGFLEDRPTTSLEAYLKLLKGIEHVYRFNKNDNALAKNLYGEAIALDPDYGPAYRLLGLTHYHDVMNAWTKYPGKSLEKAEQLAQKGLALGDDMSYFLLSNIYLQKGQFDRAIIAGEKGLAFNANNANYIAMFSIPLTAVGRHQEAIAMIKKAIRLNPYHPPWVLSVLGGVYTGAGRYEEAIEVLRKHNQLFPNFIKSHMDLTASYSLLGREQEAREAAKEVLRLDPEFSIEKYAISINMLYENQEDKKQYIDALHKAGLN